MLVSRVRHTNLTLAPIVIEALSQVPRHFFVSGPKSRAYQDTPLPIKRGQTISAPHMYAMMLSEEICKPRPGMKILEVGTGSGYGAALLAYIVRPQTLYSIERIPELVEFANQNLSKTSLENIEVVLGDGTLGLQGHKFDRILVTAAGPKVPESLLHQLESDGKIIIPIESRFEQWLCVVTYDGEKANIDKKFRVRFVPLVGREGFSK